MTMNRAGPVAVITSKTETEERMAADIANPELWGFGVATLIFLCGMAYGVWKAGWLSPHEKARTDAATLDMQRREGMR
jgi:hypothetical protein